MVDSVPLNDLVTLVLGTLAMLLMVLAIIGFAFLFQRRIIKKERAYREIEKLLEKQEIKSAYALIEGQDEERKRIASDIHDNVGNLLATLKIFSDLALNQELSSEARRLNLKINEIANSVTAELRKISHSLDSGIVQNFGLKAALDQLVEAIQNSGKLQLSVHYDITQPLPGETSLHVYRIVQELITNTLKHSLATRAHLEISQVKGDISIIFEDNGIGFNLESVTPGMGIRNIRSRLAGLQGDLKIESNPSGSTFIIEVPNPQ